MKYTKNCGKCGATMQEIRGLMPLIDKEGKPLRNGGVGYTVRFKCPNGHSES